MSIVDPPARLRPPPLRPTRVRRTAEEARRNILDAAEALLGEHGPAGLRLQDVARRAGVSHPAILHHFGSRKDLVASVTRRAVESLTAALVRTLRQKDVRLEDVIANVFAACRGGLAQRLAFLAAAGTRVDPDRRAALEQIGAVLHARRQEENAGADRAETEALVHLVGIVALGEAIFGEFLSPGETQEGRFERWFADFLLQVPAVAPRPKAAP